MKGNITVHFSDLFADTLRRHGAAWTQAYYCKRGMSALEFGIWFRGAIPAQAV